MPRENLIAQSILSPVQTVQLLSIKIIQNLENVKFGIRTAPRGGQGKGMFFVHKFSCRFSYQISGSQIHKMSNTSKKTEANRARQKKSISDAAGRGMPRENLIAQPILSPVQIVQLLSINSIQNLENVKFDIRTAPRGKGGGGGRYVFLFINLPVDFLIRLLDLEFMK